MIKLENLMNHSQTEAYLLKIGGLTLLILGKPDYSCLQYFRPSANHSVLLQKQDHLNSPYKLDLGYLKQIEISAINLILVCNYKSLLILPYIIRIKQIPILLTQPMLELGKLFCLYLLEIIQNKNRFAEETDFLKENEAFDLFEQQHNINLQNYADLYSTHELNDLFIYCKKINPGQNYEYSELILTPYHTGASIGECMWNIKSKLAGNNILIVLNGSNQTWRHCRGIQIERLLNNVTDLVVGKNIITSKQQMPLQISQLVSRIESKLRCNQNVHIHFQSNFDILDTIQLINYHLNGVFKQLVVLDSTFISFVKLTNSSVEHLSAKRENKIYNDPPEFPFSDIDILLEKGILSAGGLVEIASKQKVPVKQVLMRFKPGVYMYMTELQQIGACGQKSDIKALDFRFRKDEFKKWIDTIRPLRIWSYSKDVGNSISERQTTIKVIQPKTFEYKNQTNILKQYQLLNGSVISEFQKQYRIVPKDWSKKISTILKTFNILVQTSTHSLTTTNSKLSLNNYTFHLISSNPKEAEKIVKILISL